MSDHDPTEPSPDPADLTQERLTKLINGAAVTLAREFGLDVAIVIGGRLDLGRRVFDLAEGLVIRPSVESYRGGLARALRHVAGVIESNVGAAPSWRNETEFVCQPDPEPRPETVTHLRELVVMAREQNVPHETLCDSAIRGMRMLSQAIESGDRQQTLIAATVVAGNALCIIDRERRAPEPEAPPSAHH